MGGRLLDRFDAPGPFGLQAVLGGGLLFAAASAPNIWVFGATYALAGGVIGGTGFYSVTTAAAARLQPERPDQAIARLTILGALASPIYLPLTAWLVTETDWRTTMRILAALTVGGAVIAAVAARGAGSLSSGPSVNPIDALRRALQSSAIRRMLFVYFLAGVSFYFSSD